MRQFFVILLTGDRCKFHLAEKPFQEIDKDTAPEIEVDILFEISLGKKTSISLDNVNMVGDTRNPVQSS